jgi:prophage tail gpP-like protein
MSANAHEVRLSVSGTGTRADFEIDRWKSYEIESNMLELADAFCLTAPNIDGEFAGKVLKEDEVQVVVDGETVLVGNVDEVRYDGSDDGSTVTISGRDKGRFLVDCCAQVVSLRGQTLQSLAERLTSDWIDTWETSGAVALPSVKRMKVEPSEKVLDCLMRFASIAKVLIWIREDGVGIIGKPDYSQAITHELYRYKRSSKLRSLNNVERGTVTESSRDQFSAITALTSAANTGGGGLFGGSSGGLFGGGGKGQSKIKGTALDATVPNNKWLAIAGSTAKNAAQAKILAEEHRDLAAFRAWTGVYTVRGHKNRDELWRVNTLCSLVDELAGIAFGSYLVTRRRFMASEQGTSTEVELHPTGIYLAT